MADSTRIVVNLLERHARVPTREEILERYVRAFQGRKLGAVPGGPDPRRASAGTTAAAEREATAISEPEVPRAREPEPPSEPAQILEFGGVPDAPEAAATSHLEEPAPAVEPEDLERTQAMPAVHGIEAPEPQTREEPSGVPESSEEEPTRMMPAIESPAASSEAEEDETASENGPEGETSPDATARPSGRPGKKKKRKKHRGLGS